MNTPSNYIPDVNSFKLAGPPDHFLRKLWDFDASLVVVPSRQGFMYRLSQRRNPQLSTKIVNEALWKDSDTQMLASYNLVPVTTILATANWSNPFLFEELRRRAPWRLGGAQAVTQKLEDQERADELKSREATNEHLTSLGKDAWNLYKKKIGLQSHMYSPTPRRRGINEPPPAAQVKVTSTTPKYTPMVGSLFLP